MLKPVVLAGWTRRFELCRDCGIVGLAMVVTLLAPPVFAQTNAPAKFTASPGEEVSLLKDSKDPIEAPKPTEGEVTVKSTGTGDAKLYELTYKVPAKTLDKPVLVTYKVGSGTGSKEAKAEITVAQPPLTNVRTVLPGVDTVLLESAEPLEVEKQPAVGWAVVRTVGEPKKYQLAYVAPANAADGNVEVLYRTKDKSNRIGVMVSSNPWGTGYEAALKILFAAFVLAALIEWALAVVFNWRWYLLIFDATGTKTLFTLFVSWLIVYTFDVDIAKELINVLRSADHKSSFGTWLLSTLVVAGGSAGVNSLMVTLGLRSIRTAESLQDKPPPTKAWISFQAFGKSELVKTVEVRIKKVGDTSFKLMTVLYGIRKSRWSLRNLLLLDRSRYPSYGGISWEPGIGFEVEFQGYDEKGDSRGAVIPRGPYLPAAGALVDVVVTLD